MRRGRVGGISRPGPARTQMVRHAPHRARMATRWPAVTCVRTQPRACCSPPETRGSTEPSKRTLTTSRTIPARIAPTCMPPRSTFVRPLATRFERPRSEIVYASRQTRCAPMRTVIRSSGAVGTSGVRSMRGSSELGVSRSDAVLQTHLAPRRIATLPPRTFTMRSAGTSTSCRTSTALRA